MVTAALGAVPKESPQAMESCLAMALGYHKDHGNRLHKAHEAHVDQPEQPQRHKREAPCGSTDARPPTCDGCRDEAQGSTRHEKVLDEPSTVRCNIFCAGVTVCSGTSWPRKEAAEAGVAARLDRLTQHRSSFVAACEQVTLNAPHILKLRASLL